MSLKIFFATDVHGSDRTFRKFVAAGKHYGVNVAILSGDLTGKMIIPIVREQDGTHRVDLLGNKMEAKTDKTLKEIIEAIRSNGFYPFIGTLDEIREIDSNENKKNEVFLRFQIERLEEWLTISEMHFKGSGVKVFINAGNDDPPVVDEILRIADPDVLVNPEDRVVDVGDGHEMISSGLSNPTPWRTPRETTEDNLTTKIEEMTSKVKDMKNCIFNLHCPPFYSGLDYAPRLDEQLRPKAGAAGGADMIPVGSTAVRAALEKYQPLLGLHGHIHESKAAGEIGRTVCINPGSEYGEGILRGVVVTLEDKKVKSYYFTSG
jgi:hypothetical protein